MRPSVRSPLVLLSSLLVFACQKPPQVLAEEQAAHNDAPAAVREPAAPEAKPAPREWKPEVTKPAIIRQDLVADELPPIPTLPPTAATVSQSGEFVLPEGTHRLAPRAAVQLGEGLALVGQAYLERDSGAVAQTWQWVGVVPQGEAAADTTPRAGRKLGTGAIRAASPDKDGTALLAGTLNSRDDARGWVGTLDAQGELGLDLALDSKTLTEMFVALPGQAEGELAVALGYMDAQAWVVSLDAKGALRWQKYVSSFGYTQIRAAVRLDGERGDLLAVGTRAQGFGESWWSQLPGDGGGDPSADDVEQGKLDIEGADQHQMLRAIVDVGDAGYIALGTAMRNHIQAHKQVIAVGFDRQGKPSWSRVIPGLRITEISGGGSSSASPGIAHFVVEVPLPGDADHTALAWLELGAGTEGSVSARMLQGSQSWKSAGLVEGSAQPLIASYRALESGMSWQLLAAPLPK